MGAYFSLLAYKDEDIKQCLFLSPVVNSYIDKGNTEYIAEYVRDIIGADCKNARNKIEKWL